MSRGTYQDLQSATTVGQKLATEWPGDYENYLKVLPRTNTSIQSGWMDWQKANKNHSKGNYKKNESKRNFLFKLGAG